MPNAEQRVKALMAHLDETDRDEISIDGYDVDARGTEDATHFERGNESYLVLTDEEADKAIIDHARESAWAFKAGFLAEYMPQGVDSDVIEMLQEKCEGANEAILAMLGDNFESMANDAASADGRGHFLASYDGHEHEVETECGQDLYIYRTN